MSIGDLHKLFGGRPPVFVSDSDDLVNHLDQMNLMTMRLEDLRHGGGLPGQAAILLVTDFGRLGPRRELEQMFRKSRVLWIPLASFDASLEASLYAVSILLSSDLEAAVAENRRWIDTFASSTKPLRFVGGGTGLVAELGDPLLATSQLEVELPVGRWRSIGAYTEASLTAGSEDLLATFRVNGTLRADGFATARHSGMPENLFHLHDEASKLIADFVDAAEVVLEIKDSQVIHCWANDEDISARLVPITNERYDLHVLEFAVGTNRRISRSINWRFNSQLNEGSGGVHVGIGEGLTGAHIDFVCTQAELVT